MRGVRHLERSCHPEERSNLGPADPESAAKSFGGRCSRPPWSLRLESQRYFFFFAAFFVAFFAAFFVAIVFYSPF
jgi:hypothetical protein